MSEETTQPAGGVIARLSDAYRALTRREGPAVNPLHLYEPLSLPETKALDIPHPRGSGYGVPSYSSWGAWDRALYGGGYRNSKIDYASEVGPAEQSSLIMAAVRWLGNTLPEADLQVKESPDKKGASEPVPNHDLTALWRKPNPNYSGSTLVKAFAFSWITKGDVYFIKVRDRMARVRELWYEPHWTIRPRWYGDNAGAFEAREGDDREAFISYYEVDRGQKKYRLEAADVIHFRDGLDPANPRCGLSGLNAILRELYGDQEAANYFARLLGGSGVPPFVLMLDKELKVEQEDVERIEEKAYRKTTGDQKGRPLVLYGGTDMKQLSFSPKDMDVRSVRYLAEERFCAVTGIPAVVLELGSGSEHSIYNNVRQASERAVESYLVPLWRHVEEELNVQLLPDFEAGAGRYCRYDLSNVRALQEDEDAAAQRLRDDWQADGISLAEFRSGRGYEAKPGMEEVYYSQWKAAPAEEDGGGGQDDDGPPVKSVPPVPSEEEVEEVVGWWDKVAPEGAAGILSASVTGNGNGARNGR